MRLTILIVAALLAPAAAGAEESATNPPETEVVVVTAASAPASSTVLPHKGMTKSSVISEYGQPSTRRPPVGGGSVHQPPITRWDYDGYSVIFENDHVVDTVQKDNPAPIKIRDGLAGEPR